MFNKDAGISELMIPCENVTVNGEHSLGNIIMKRSVRAFLISEVRMCKFITNIILWCVWNVAFPFDMLMNQ